MTKKKSCPFCAAEYLDNLPACPYCGTMNYKGAEAEYLEKLENVRTDMENLGDVPVQEMKKEFRSTLRFMWKVFIGIAILAVLLIVWYAWINHEPERDPQADYLWKQTNYPIFDELYEKRDYEELVRRYREAVENDQLIYDWEHDYFCGALDDLFYVEAILERLAAGEELSDYYYEDLVYYGWKYDGFYLEEHLTEEEIELITPYVEHYLEDFHARWEFTEKERAEFTEHMNEHYGHPSFDLCEDYINKWKKEQRKK